MPSKFTHDKVTRRMNTNSAKLRRRKTFLEIHILDNYLHLALKNVQLITCSVNKLEKSKTLNVLNNYNFSLKYQNIFHGSDFHFQSSKNEPISPLTMIDFTGTTK